MPRSPSSTVATPLARQAPAPRDVQTEARWGWLDAARGGALAAMVVYHFAWDLDFARVTALGAATEPGWRLFARAIAASFLLVAGISLALAHRDGFRPASFWRRFAILAGAAGLVTLATWLALPDAVIVFGILHCLAIASLMGAALLPAPLAVIVGAAGLSLALPALIALPQLNSWPWLALGLGTRVPTTADWVPVFPWAGFLLAGLAIGRVLPRDARHWGADFAAGPVGSRLAWAGRRSLPIYLLHQPALLAVAFGLAALLGPSASIGPPVEAGDGFTPSCRASCRTDPRASAQACVELCACLKSSFQARGLWATVLADRVAEIDRGLMTRMVEECRAPTASGATRPAAPQTSPPQASPR